MIVRTAAQRPVVFAICFFNRKVIDARNAAAHEAVAIELPVLVAVGAVPQPCSSCLSFAKQTTKHTTTTTQKTKKKQKTNTHTHFRRRNCTMASRPDRNSARLRHVRAGGGAGGARAGAR